MNIFIKQAPGAWTVKLFEAVINSVVQWASVFVKVRRKWHTITKTLAYNASEFIAAMNIFIKQAPGAWTVKLFEAVINSVVQ